MLRRRYKICEGRRASDLVLANGRTGYAVGADRSAVAAFVEAYNESWLLAKLGYKSPRAYRREHEARAGSTEKVA